MEWEGTLRAVQEGTKLLILKNLALGFSKPPSYVNQAFVRQRAPHSFTPLGGLFFEATPQLGALMELSFQIERFLIIV